MLTVQELYDKNKTPTNKKLLGNYTYTWMGEYNTNYAMYDNYFRRRYSSFRYAEGETLEDFKDDVAGILLVNRKKYEELFRIYTVEDDVFGVASNYDMTEIMSRTTSENGSVVSGSRTDTDNTTTSSTQTTDSKVDSTATSGERTDTNTNTGTNSESTTSTNSGSIISGQRTDISNLQVGSQNEGVVNKVTAFNSNSENTQTSGTSSTGTRNDISQFTKGQETDVSQGEQSSTVSGSSNNSTSNVKGSETDTSSVETDAEVSTSTTNTDTFAKGEQTDTSTNSGTENYTLTKKGNIGVQTSADILRVSGDLINSGIFEFYKMIFSDIYKELLLV